MSLVVAHPANSTNTTPMIDFIPFPRLIFQELYHQQEINTKTPSERG